MREKYNKVMFIIFVALIGVLFVYSKSYALLESETNGKADLNISQWHIKVNDLSLTSNLTDKLEIKDFNWNNTSNVADGKITPGSIGYVDLNIDPTTTGVAFTYTINYTDFTINSDYILTLKSITGDDTLIRTGKGEYTGVFTVSDLEKEDNKRSIRLTAEWVSNDTTAERDKEILETDEVDYLKITMKVKQYNGEEITLYVPDENEEGSDDGE